VIWEQCTYKGNNINWILDADVSGFFDNINHKLLREIIRGRVNDGGLLRYIGKWLNAGVQEGTVLSYSDTGTPQGGVISPLLANIFLHHVFDDWFVKEVKPRMKGHCFLVRFADDFVIGFEEEVDARRVMSVLFKRFARFDLSIHPKKTKLIHFGRPDGKVQSDIQNETFDFLGFTLYWGKTRKGSWVIKKKTSKKRFKRTMKSLWSWREDNRHEPVAEQFKILCSKLRGHFQYYGVRGNYQLLEQVFQHAEKAWKYWLGRRSRTSYITWDKFDELRLIFGFPRPRIVHDI
jgi:group II intron reverse transcriptase/maturase